jgi:hypothetical protein
MSSIELKPRYECTSLTRPRSPRRMLGWVSNPSSFAYHSALLFSRYHRSSATRSSPGTEASRRDAGTSREREETWSGGIVSIKKRKRPPENALRSSLASDGGGWKAGPCVALFEYPWGTEELRVCHSLLSEHQSKQRARQRTDQTTSAREMVVVSTWLRRNDHVTQRWRRSKSQHIGTYMRWRVLNIER